MIDAYVDGRLDALVRYKAGDGWPSWVEGIFGAYAYDADDTGAMREKIYDGYVRTYEQTVRQTIGDLGCEPGEVALKDEDELKSLEMQADKWSTGIANTYNKWLGGQIDRELQAYVDANGSLKGFNRYKLTQELRSDVRNYWRGQRLPNDEEGNRRWRMGKLSSIAVTEQTRAVAMGTFGFFRNNEDFGTKFRVIPGSAVCDLCKEAVAQGAMTLEEAQRWDFPLHVNCLTPGQRVLTMEEEALIENIKAGDIVMTHQGPAEVGQVLRQRHVGQVLRLSVGGRVLELTGDHPVLTRSGWLAARDLSVGDEVMSLGVSWKASCCGKDGTERSGCLDG